MGGVGRSKPPLAGECRVGVALFLVLVVTLCVGGGACSGSIPTTGEAVPGMKSVDRVITELLTKWQMPGAAVGIVKDGRLVFARGYGWADKDNSVPVQPDSLFRIASVSKPITAAAILTLVEQGKVSLDDKAFKILNNLQPPRGTSPDRRLYDITIRQLLEHVGGWDTQALGYDPQFALYETAADALGTSRPANAETIVRYMMGHPLSFTPGTKFCYSNFGYNVLGRVIEKVTGQSYESYVKTNVLAPMGITRMQIGHTLEGQQVPGEVCYYAHSNALVPSVFPNGGPVTWPYGRWSLEAMDSHGGWIASVIDLLRFVTHVDGRTPPADTLRSDTIATMISRPSVPSWKGSAYWYALGWDVRPASGDANWWHMGSLDGTTSLLVRAYNGLAWCVLVNSRPRNSDAFNTALDNAMWTAIDGVTSWPSYDLF
jgi:CubicO group peptidase (beta-lactamase class C family)